ncbi:MAG: COX15/CtaA family protein [Planctomycetota bacterium]
MSYPNATPPRWTHVIAWVLCVVTFPLIWVGGLITTTDAGMAVPDWPGTYGYNLFLYPWQTWFFGPWDLFIEHGHRLLASLVGLVTIGLVVAAFREQQSKRVRRLAVGALLLVCFQGFLGGARVLINARHLALLHGSTGPLFFVVTVLLVAATAKARRGPDERSGWLAAALPFLLYCQLVLGATLRHTPEEGDPWAFALHVQSHLWMAAVVALATLAVAVFDTWGNRRRFAGLLATVLLVQVSLGAATWIAKYRYPGWAHPTASLTAAADGRSLAPPRVRGWAMEVVPATIQPATASGFAETVIVTGHSAIGSLLLALATARAVRWGDAGGGVTATHERSTTVRDPAPKTSAASPPPRESVLV